MAGPAGPRDDRWIGGLTNRKAREAFTELSTALLRGDYSGVAAAFSYVESPADLTGLPEYDGLESSPARCWLLSLSGVASWVLPPGTALIGVSALILVL